MTVQGTFYDLLGVSRTATTKDIKAVSATARNTSQDAVRAEQLRNLLVTSACDRLTAKLR